MLWTAANPSLLMHWMDPTRRILEIILGSWPVFSSNGHNMLEVGPPTWADLSANSSHKKQPDLSFCLKVTGWGQICFTDQPLPLLKGWGRWTVICWHKRILDIILPLAIFSFVHCFCFSESFPSWQATENMSCTAELDWDRGVQSLQNWNSAPFSPHF